MWHFQKTMEIAKINRNYKCVGNSELPSSGNMQYVIFSNIFILHFKKHPG